MQVIGGLLLIGSVGAAGIGVLGLSEATFGVGLLALACYFGILTRIIQASEVPPKKPKPIAPIWNTEKKDVGPMEIQCKQCGLVTTRGPSHCTQCGAKLPA